MIAETLQRLEADFRTATDSPADTARWTGQVARCAAAIDAIGSEMMNSLSSRLPARVFTESVVEVVVPRQPQIIMAEFRLRPTDSYYDSVGEPRPAPANPSGPHATGIAFHLRICRGFVNGRSWRPSRLSLEFEVWGERERAAFLAMFTDYGRSVQRVLRIPALGFFSACWFDEVQKPASKSAVTQLMRYMTVASDPESCFTLAREFDETATPDQLVAAAVPLLILYDACYGYCKPRKAKGRLDQYNRRIQREKRHNSLLGRRADPI